MVLASMGGTSATTTTTAATAATRRTAKEGMTSKLVAGTVRAPVAAATVPVTEKTPGVNADVVICFNAPVDSVSGCTDL